MRQEVIVRPAKPTDASGIYEVMRQSRQEAFAGLLPPDALDWDSEMPEAFQTFVHSTISHEEKALSVAICDGTVVGVAELVWQFEGTEAFVRESEAELKALHVRPTKWNEGVGTKLLDEAVGTLPAHISGVTLCVLTGNERARAFYASRGFEQTGTTPTTYADEERIEAVYRRLL